MKPSPFFAFDVRSYKLQILTCTSQKTSPVKKRGAGASLYRKGRVETAAGLKISRREIKSCSTRLILGDQDKLRLRCLYNSGTVGLLPDYTVTDGSIGGLRCQISLNVSRPFVGGQNFKFFGCQIYCNIFSFL